MKNKKAKVIGFLVGLGLFGALVWGGATFSRITTWASGQTLTASALNAEFNNILNNLKPSGIDDYSGSVTEMRSTANPYPGSAESQPTSLQGEIERLRYQVLQIKKAFQISGENDTYWYQDLPTQGYLSIQSQNSQGYVGINDTSPDAMLSIDGGASNNATFALHGGSLHRFWIVGSSVTDAMYFGNSAAFGMPTTTDYSFKAASDKTVTFSTNVTIGGNVSILGTLSAVSNSSSKVVARSTHTIQTVNAGFTNRVLFVAEDIDTQSEFSTSDSSFTAASTGYFRITANVEFIAFAIASSVRLSVYKNGTEIAYTALTADAINQVRIIPFSTILNLTAGDALALFITPASSGINVLGDATKERTIFTIERI